MERSAKIPNPLGDVLRDLLKQRKMKAVELGHRTGVSATSISKIINGVTRPRQSTFTRMCQELCKTKDDERRLVSAFLGTELLKEDEQAPYNGKLPENISSEQEILRLRAEQFIERKTQSIAFKRAVAKELYKAGIEYKADYCEGIYSTDFLIEKDGRRIALECKANIERDMDRTIAIAEVLRGALKCELIVVAPYFSPVATSQTTEFPIVTLKDAIDTIDKIWD